MAVSWCSGGDGTVAGARLTAPVAGVSARLSVDVVHAVVDADALSRTAALAVRQFKDMVRAGTV